MSGGVAVWAGLVLGDMTTVSSVCCTAVTFVDGISAVVFGWVELGIVGARLLSLSWAWSRRSLRIACASKR